MATEYRRIQNRIDTSAPGELGIESDTRKFKFGNGSAWNNTEYAGTEVDLTNYYTKGEADNKFATGQMLNNLSTDLNRKIDEKVNTTTFEAKIEEVEGKIDNIGDNLATVATSGSYNDLSDKPYIPTNISDLNNDSDYTTNEALEGAKQALQEAIDTKVDTTTYEGKINEIEAEIEDRYTKSEVDIKVNEAKGETGTVETKLDTHIADNVKHITAAERTSWNSKTTMAEVEAKDYDTVNSVNGKIDAAKTVLQQSIDTKASDADFSAHKNNDIIHITEDERTAWNGKTTMAEVEAKNYTTKQYVDTLIGQLEEITDEIIGQ